MPIHGRRNFLKQAAALAGAFSSNSLFHQAHAEEWKAASNALSALSPAEAAQNEDYWAVIQRSYSVNSNLINLNNGGVSPAPVVVQQAPVTYVERPQSERPQQKAAPDGMDPSYWYYCHDPAGYFPYVQQCSESWQQVTPTPPAQ